MYKHTAIALDNGNYTTIGHIENMVDANASANTLEPHTASAADVANDAPSGEISLTILEPDVATVAPTVLRRNQQTRGTSNTNNATTSSNAAALSSSTSETIQNLSSENSLNNRSPSHNNHAQPTQLQHLDVPQNQTNPTSLILLPHSGGGNSGNISFAPTTNSTAPADMAGYSTTTTTMLPSFSHYTSGKLSLSTSSTVITIMYCCCNYF